jgi:hypothetical protein
VLRDPLGGSRLSSFHSSKHTANGAEPQFHVLLVNLSITSWG